jgi:hypothetical protein
MTPKNEQKLKKLSVKIQNNLKKMIKAYLENDTSVLYN